MEILILVLMGFVFQAGKADGANRPVGFYWGGAAVTMNRPGFCRGSGV